MLDLTIAMLHYRYFIIQALFDLTVGVNLKSSYKSRFCLCVQMTLSVVISIIQPFREWEKADFAFDI